MYAIQVEDMLADDVKVLPTLATDEEAALLLMRANAELWVSKQQVDLGFKIITNDQLLQVNVTADDHVVLDHTAWPITKVVSALEFVQPTGEPH